METLATIDAPHQKNGTTGQNSRIQTSSRPLPRSTRHLQFARPRHVPRPKPNRRNRQKSRQRCTQQKPRLQHSRPEHIAPLQSTGNMITELATALICRGRPAVRTTYQRFMAHIKNGSCSKHPTSTRTSFTEHENMLRLRKSLRGKAKDAVRNLLNYSKNSETVMNALENASDDDAIAIAEIQNLRTLQRPTDSPNNGSTSAEQPQEEPDLIKMARFLEREAERCSAYAPPETITQPRGYDHTDEKNTENVFTSANRRETQNRTDRRVRAPYVKNET
ncbi:hypothetical protein EVAR_88199_1 [Eumeta japonica]|uniref:Uncharacterized protein n=1 Tax=Eumeta variegata TaxID=151549 RepID=A0A4C1WBG6_EUMVA|nr:hypothetical protein EVAR_88199_1 [Eumeta japonica]